MKKITQKMKKTVPIFQVNSYRKAEDQVEYIYDLLLVILYKQKQQTAILCMNELSDILNQIQIPLKLKQLHELYLYATYQKYQSKADTKKKITALINQQKRKVDIKGAAKWIHENIQRNQINFMVKTRAESGKQLQSNLRKINKIQGKLPPVKGTVGEKLQQELKFLIEIFQEMERQRQNSGLIPINLQAQDQELELPSTNIPYDPQLFQLNKNLAKLKIRAQERLARIIELAKDDPKVRYRLQQSIEKFQRLRIEANEKVGRNGAMKAQKRLIEARKKQNDKFKNLKLGEEQDLIRAAQMYSLLSIQEVKSNRLIP